MEVRAKKALGQHFLTDQSIAMRIVDALRGSDVLEVGPGMGVLTQYLIPSMAGQPLERGRVHSRFAAAECGLSSTSAPATRLDDTRLPESLRSRPLNRTAVATLDGGNTATLGTLKGGTGAERSDASGGAVRNEAVEPQEPATAARHLKVVEIDKESVVYLKKHYTALGDGLIEGDFLKMDLSSLFPGQFSIIGNFPYNISSQIFFKILDNRDLVPEVVCMIQKEVAERIAEKPGTKTYGIMSVFLQAWYDIEYLFTVGPGAFNPPPKVQSAVIRLTRNSRTSLGCDEKLFRTVVKSAFGQRRKTLRNSLKPLLANKQSRLCNPNEQSPDPHPELSPESVEGQSQGFPGSPESPISPVPPESPESLTSDPVFDLRPERLSVEDFIALTLKLQ